MSNLIQILALGSFLLIIVIAALTMGGYVRHAFRGRSAAFRLGRELGLAPAGPSRVEKQWRVGSLDGRPYALCARVKRTPGVGESRASVRFYLRIAVAVDAPELRAVSVKRAIEHRGSTDAFDSAFVVKPESEGLLGPEREEALRAFVDRSYPRGWMTGSALLGREKRSLFLLGRETLQPIDLPPSVFPDAPAVLLYDHARPNAATEQILEAVAELGALADALAARG